MKKQRLLFALARVAHKATRDEYWRHVNSGGRTRPSIRVNAPVLAPGTVLNATDRAYVVTHNGSWRVQEHFTKSKHIPAFQSQIRLLPEVKPVRLRREAT